jgi:hypothetical protein
LQKATKFLWRGSSGKIEVFFVKSFGRDRLIVSNGKTGKCHFVAGGGLGKDLPLKSVKDNNEIHIVNFKCYRYFIP